MLPSHRLMNLLRNSLLVLNPRVISSIRPFSRTFPSICKLAKQSTHNKYLLFTRGISQLPQQNDGTSDMGGRFVQMKGLPFEATREDIINFFKPLDIEPVEITFQTNRTGRPNGFASVKFKSYDDALKALQNHRNYIGRRYIELSLDMRPTNQEFSSSLQQRSLASQSNFSMKGYRVFLKGIPYEATTNDIVKFFAPLNIKPVHVNMRLGRFNLPSGMCDCIFENQDDALTALKNNRAYIGKRWIEVIVNQGLGTSFSQENSGIPDVRTPTDSEKI